MKYSTKQVGNIKEVLKMEDNVILIDGYETTIDKNGDARIVGTLDGETFEIGVICNANNLDAADLHNRVELTLKINGFAVKPAPAPKPKRKYTRRVNLGLASDYGKVTLNVVDKEPKSITCYNLFIKGTDKFVYKLDEKGIYVTNAKKTRPMDFTVDDIKRIRNTSDFDIVKVVKHAHFIKNKIAGC